jgi:hypothetical protein
VEKFSLKNMTYKTRNNISKENKRKSQRIIIIKIKNKIIRETVEIKVTKIPTRIITLLNNTIIKAIKVINKLNLTINKISSNKVKLDEKKIKFI